MNSTTEHPKQLHVDVVADGDLVLVVGPEKSRLRVYSTSMKLGSKDFKTMLSSNFLEGSKLKNSSPNNPAEIDLPEDNTRAFTLVCSILHHRNDLIQKILTVEDCVELAKLAHKYNFQDSIKDTVAARGLIPTGKFSRAIREIFDCLAADYILCSDVAFEKLTDKLISNYNGRKLLALANQEDGLYSLLPGRIFDAEELKEARIMAKEDLIFLLAKVVRYLGACKSCEENQDDHIEAIEDMIQENWPLDDARTRLSKMVSEHEYCQTSCVRETAILGSITSNHFGIELRDYSILEKLRASESRRKGESETRLPPNDQPQGKKFRKQEVKS